MSDSDCPQCGCDQFDKIQNEHGRHRACQACGMTWQTALQNAWFHLEKSHAELTQAKQLIKELVEVAEFCAARNISADAAREVLSKNKDIIQRLTEEKLCD